MFSSRNRLVKNVKNTEADFIAKQLLGVGEARCDALQSFLCSDLPCPASPGSRCYLGCAVE